jgi:hypothetical protein
MKNFKDIKMSSSPYLKPIADWPSRCSSFFNALLVERRHRPHLPQVLTTSKLIQQQRDKMTYKQMKSDPSSDSSSSSSSSKVHQLN